MTEKQPPINWIHGRYFSVGPEDPLFDPEAWFAKSLSPQRCILYEDPRDPVGHRRKVYMHYSLPLSLDEQEIKKQHPEIIKGPAVTLYEYNPHTLPSKHTIFQGNFDENNRDVFRVIWPSPKTIPTHYWIEIKK